MIYKTYGKTGKKISAVSFGGMRFANPDNIDANAVVVLHAYRRGINYFDTAPFYCNDKSEEIVGAAVKQMDRDNIYVSTKCMDSTGDGLRKSLEKSLKRLNVDCIDFFHIWCLLTLDGWQERKTGGALAAAQKAKEEGLISHLVVSSHLNGPELSKVLAEGVFEGTTLGYCAINFPYRQDAVDAAGRMNLGVVTMNPLGGGAIPKNAKRFDFIRSPKDATVTAAALRFNVSQPAITSALVGFTTVEQIDEAVAAVENFQPYDTAHILSMRKKILDSFKGLCTGCGYCLPCPAGIDIPRMMDAYNCTILQGKTESAVGRLHWHWGLKPADAKACSLCGACEERCTQKLPIRDRLKELAAIPEKTGG